MKLIAHRGLSHKAPENSIPAFELAAASKPHHGIECDIHQTKDDKFVVFHDDDLKRMVKSDFKIKDLTFDELETMTLKSGRNVKKYIELKIPKLTEYLDICSKGNKTAVIEIKHLNDITQSIHLLNELEGYPKLHIIIISFDMNILKFIRALSDMPLQYLTSKINDDIIYDCRANRIDLSLDKKIISKDLVKRLKKEGFKIGVWTVDDPLRFEIYKRMGVHYLTSNRL